MQPLNCKTVVILLVSVPTLVMITAGSPHSAFADPLRCDQKGWPTCYSVGYQDGLANPGTSCPSGHSSNFCAGWDAGAVPRSAPAPSGVDWKSFCNQASQRNLLIQSCSQLVNPNGTLTQVGNNVVGCLVYGLVLVSIGLPPSSVIMDLSPNPDHAKCFELVNMDAIRSPNQSQFLTHALANMSTSVKIVPTPTTTRPSNATQFTNATVLSLGNPGSTPAHGRICQVGPINRTPVPCDQIQKQREKNAGIITAPFPINKTTGLNATSTASAMNTTGVNTHKPTAAATMNRPVDKQNDRYYEGLNWWGVCNNPLLRSYITQSCDVLVTPDKNALTSKGKVALEGILCPRGPSIVTTLELFYGTIPQKLKNDLGVACGWH